MTAVPHHIGDVNTLEYMVTSAFSAIAAVFSYLARRSGKRNTQSLDHEVKPKLSVLEKRTNGELMDKIRQAVREAVDHDELVAAVSEEAVRNYLDGILLAHLESNEEGRSLFDDIHKITERREARDDGE